MDDLSIERAAFAFQIQWFSASSCVHIVPIFEVSSRIDLCQSCLFNQDRPLNSSDAELRHRESCLPVWSASGLALSPQRLSPAQNGGSFTDNICVRATRAVEEAAFIS